MGVIAPLQGAVPVSYNGQNVWAHFRAYGDGYAGYVPNNAAYAGKGLITPIGKSARGGLRRQDTNLSARNQADNESDLRFVGESLSMLLNGNIDKCLTVFGGEAADFRSGLLNSFPQTNLLSLLRKKA